MAMGKRKRHANQASMWVATQDLPRSGDDWTPRAWWPALKCRPVAGFELSIEASLQVEVRLQRIRPRPAVVTSNRCTQIGEQPQMAASTTLPSGVLEFIGSAADTDGKLGMRAGSPRNISRRW
jgi:hypothetical protein